MWPGFTLGLDGHDAPRRALPEVAATLLPFAEHRPQLAVLIRARPVGESEQGVFFKR